MNPQTVTVSPIAPKVKRALSSSEEEIKSGYKLDLKEALKTAQEACFKSWEANGFYYMSNLITRVLHSSKSTETYIFKIFFPTTGAMSVQGTPTKISESSKRLSDFEKTPHLCFCFSEELKKNLYNFFFSLNSRLPSSHSDDADWNLARVVSSLFNQRLQTPKATTLFTFLKNYIHLSPHESLIPFFRALDESIKYVVNQGSLPYQGAAGCYKARLGKGIRPSAPVSIENFNNTDQLLEDPQQLVSAFLEDYARNMKGWSWKRIPYTLVFRHFLIWASKLSGGSSSSFLSLLPYKTPFYRILMSLPGVEYTKSTGNDYLLFNKVIVKDPTSPAIKNSFSFLENYEAWEESYKKSLQSQKENNDFVPVSSELTSISEPPEDLKTKIHSPLDEEKKFEDICREYETSREPDRFEEEEVPSSPAVLTPPTVPTVATTPPKDFASKYIGDNMTKFEEIYLKSLVPDLSETSKQSEDLNALAVQEYKAKKLAEEKRKEEIRKMERMVEDTEAMRAASSLLPTPPKVVPKQSEDFNKVSDEISSPLNEKKDFSQKSPTKE